jgi:hypothetical protein
MFIVKYDALGNVLWAKSAGGTNLDYGAGISTDNSGNVYVTGYFSSSLITFGTTTLINSGTYDMFIVKYDSSGNVLWAKSAGGTNTDFGISIFTGVGGNVYLAGFFYSSSITFGTTILSNTGSADIFLVKYDVSGNELWAKSEGGTYSDWGYGISTDAAENVYLTGYFLSSSITFGTTALTNAGSNSWDMFIAKYDSSGNVLWAKSAGGTNDEKGNSISSDADNNVHVTGIFESPTIIFGTTTLTNAGGEDVFIVKYDSSGNVLWAKSAGDINDDRGYDNYTDVVGNVYVLGSFTSDSINFGATTLTNAGIVIGADLFIVKYDPSGNLLWAKSAGGTDYEEGYGVSTDTSGENVYVTGYFISPTITFVTTTLTNVGDGDVFIAKLASTTGIKENSNSPNQISISPNPTSSTFTITFPNTIHTGTIEIYNVFGEKVMEETIYNTTAKEISVKPACRPPAGRAGTGRNITAGIYFVKVSADENQYVKKLVVQ